METARISTRPQPQAEYDRGWNDGYKHGAWASKPQAERPAERVALIQAIDSIKQEAETGLLIGDEAAMRDALETIIGYACAELGITLDHGITAKDQS